MKGAKIGQYHYGRHYNCYGVWKYVYVKDGATSSDHIADFMTREEARLFVWKMNGWGSPKTALAK